jgi:hypothetical protein
MVRVDCAKRNACHTSPLACDNFGKQARCAQTAGRGLAVPGKVEDFGALERAAGLKAERAASAERLAAKVLL